MGHPRTRTADMSDAPQGDDWWLASDGRWYPPSSRTGSQLPPPPPAPPGATNVLLAPALTGWLRGLMWAYVAVTVAMVAVGVAYWGAIEGLRRGDVALDDAIGLENAYQAVAGVQSVAWVSIFVLMIVWLAKAHTATTSLLAVPGARKYSRGWCIGVWFIPFANFISTPQVFAEHQRIADAARTDGWVKGDWKSLPSSRLIPWWWICVIGALFLGRAAGTNAVETADDIGAYSSDILQTVVSDVLMAVGTVLGAIFIGRVGGKLARRIA